MRNCAAKNCTAWVKTATYCKKHNMRFKRHGDPNYINLKCNRDGKRLERNRARTKKWKKDNWTYYKSYLEARRMRVKLATPIWADITAIEEFYRNRPTGHHVDHIIPLNGINCSGLHVLSNLQYLPANENLRKGRKVS